MSVSRLVDALWGDNPPRTAIKNLQVHVHRLRQGLSEVPQIKLVTVGNGYLIEVDPDQIDLHRFRTLVRQAGGSTGARASGLLAEGLALWRGPALADAGGPLLRTIGAQLDEERLAALETRLELELDLGRHRESLVELSGLVEAYPLREHLRSLLMLALFRSGRQADALATFHAARSLLRDELGIDPGSQLRAMHERILRDDPTLAATAGPAPASSPAPVATAPRRVVAELPHDIRGYAGRRAELAELDALLAASEDEASTASVIVTIDGLGGIGKTALVVHWAHRVRGRFPGGVHYLDLRGHHPQLAPLSAEEALGQLLLGLGVATGDLPGGESERARLLRSLLADGRRLIVLDNAAGADQVRPLLPGAASCLTVVTARQRLGGLIAIDGAHRIQVRPLGTEESVALLDLALGSDRIRADSAASDRLADLCGGFPLALRIAAANLAGTPDRAIGDLVTELADDRLAALRVYDDDQVAMRSAFDLSYRAQTGPARLLFCQLGSGPSLDFTAAAADAVAGTDSTAAVRELAVAHLVEERTAGRYAMHDLLRAYAVDRLGRDFGAGERTGAVRRLVAWQLAGARGATAMLNIPRLLVPPGPDPATGPAEFDTAAAAMNWLESERTNMVAAVIHLAAHDPVPAGWQLAVELRGFLRLRRYVTEWVAITTAAMEIARHLGDERAQAALCHSLGHANWSRGDYPEAVESYKRTYALSTELGWREGEAGALSALGAVYHEMGQHDEAIASYREALDTGALSGPLELITLGSLGLVYQSVGRLRDAVDSFLRTLQIARERGFDDMAATSLGNLGMSYLELGNLAEARRYLNEALALYQQSGSRNGEANVRTGLAMLEAEYCAYDDAAYQAALALRVARDIDDRRIECDALCAAGMVASRRGDAAGARERLVEAIEVADTIGYGRGLAPALTELAAVELSLSDPRAAASTAQRALAIARRAGRRSAEARALAVLARIDLARGHYDSAIRQAQQSVATCRDLGLDLDLARGLYTLDTALRDTQGLSGTSGYRDEADAIMARLRVELPQPPL